MEPNTDICQNHRNINGICWLISCHVVRSHVFGHRGVSKYKCGQAYSIISMLIVSVPPEKGDKLRFASSTVNALNVNRLLPTFCLQTPSWTHLFFFFQTMMCFIKLNTPIRTCSTLTRTSNQSLIQCTAQQAH